jgi:hypothetical protein
MLGQRQKKLFLVLGCCFLFCFNFEINITVLILLESRAVKDIKKACFNMEINLRPKNLHALSYEVRVMNV